MTKDIPIIFSGPMVRALLEGRKTMTRRILKPQPQLFEVDGKPCDVGMLHVEGEPRPRLTLGRVVTTREIRYAPGDRLWVRETWQTGMGPDGPQITFKATPDYFSIDAWDGPDEGIGPSFNYDRCPGATWHTNLSDLLSGSEGGWRSPIHMPRWASRLTLAVTAVKVERLHDVSLPDAMAEGCEIRQMWLFGLEGEARRQVGVQTFRRIWEEINGTESWQANPFVVAISFRVIKANIDAPEAKVAA